MLTGHSILHVNQDLGRHFSTTELKGYYNNLTEKVIRLPHLLDNEELPTSPDESIFRHYQEKWERDKSSKLCFARAFVKKAWQKLRE